MAGSHCEPNPPTLKPNKTLTPPTSFPREILTQRMLIKGKYPFLVSSLGSQAAAQLPPSPDPVGIFPHSKQSGPEKQPGAGSAAAPPQAPGEGAVHLGLSQNLTWT